MKKIAMITDGWKRMVTYAWVDGMINRIHELDEDICIYQYNCYGNWRKEKKYNQGEYNIFRLPDLNEFDGDWVSEDKKWMNMRTTVLLPLKMEYR